MLVPNFRMKLNELINALAEQADRLLEGARSRVEARLALGRIVEKNAQLSTGEREAVIDGVMSVLEDACFFTEERWSRSPFRSDTPVSH